MKHIPLSIDSLRGSEEKYEFLFFYNEHSKDSEVIDVSCLNQWYPSAFVYGGEEYKTCEQFMMAQKAVFFKDFVSFDKIMGSSSPREAKKIGRQVKNFDENKWNEQKYDIVFIGNWLKFFSDNNLRMFLKSTSPKILVEASPYDKIWGIGLGMNDERKQDPFNWRGKNLLGFALTEVRSLI